MRLTSRALHLLATNPNVQQQYFRTGKLPTDDHQRVKTPLIALINSIPPRDRLLIKGIQIGPSLGYTRTLQFHNAAQLHNWLCPSHGGGTAANASADRRFSRTLTIDDLSSCCSDLPAHVARDWWARHQNLSHLRRG